MAIERLEFHEEAAAEYDATFDWYLDRSPEAARKFDAELERALIQVVQAPKRWALGPFDTRRYLLRRFPFVLIYRERGTKSLEVIALAHKPKTWVLEDSPMTSDSHGEN